MTAHDRPYFFFGTLMDDDVLTIVLGRGLAELRTETARLDGFRRLKVKGESYPTLRSDPGAWFEGLLVWRLKAPELARIAFYEGEEYRLIEMPVRRANGTTQQAMVFATDQEGVATDGEWDLARWHATERPHLIAAARAFMVHFGSVGEAAIADRRWREARARARRAFNRSARQPGA